MRNILWLALAGMAGIGGAQQVEKGFEDRFEWTKLNERWTWHAPVAGPKWEVKTDGLNISIPKREKGFNFWTGAYDAPMLTTPAPDGDFDVDTKIVLKKDAPASQYHIGLMIGFGEKQVLEWGLYQSKQNGADEPQLWLEMTGKPGILKLQKEAKEAFLRFEKRGDVYRVLYWAKEEGEEGETEAGEMKWLEAGKFRWPFAPKYFGIIGKTFGDGPGVTFAIGHVAFIQRHMDHEPLTAKVTVSPTDVVGEIGPNIYGHFIEHLGRCIHHGIWAEVLTNRKFAGNAGHDGAVEPWNALDPGDGFEAIRDNVTFYTGDQSQRLTFRGNDTERGVVQHHLDFNPGELNGRIVLRGHGLTAPVVVSVRSGASIVASAEMPAPTDDWATSTFKLTVPSALKDASFAISSKSPNGTLWIGCASLMPADAIDEMRRDVIEAIKGCKPPVVRWPGGNFASGYHWKDGLGDPDKRPARHDRAWNSWEMNDFGTDEFVKFCRLVGCAPYICANAGEALEDEAVEWVTYCKDHKYNVRYWGIGNEMYGDWQLGHLSAENYARKAADFGKAMRAADPSVVLIAVGVDGGGWDEWNAKVVRGAGADFDMLSVHFYQGIEVAADPAANYLTVIKSPGHVERMLAETAAIIKSNAPGGKAIPIAFDEWNVWPDEARGNELTATYQLRDGLFAAGIFHALHRLAGPVKMANLAQLVNVLGALRTNLTEVVKTPIFLAFEMYVNHFGHRAVRSTCASAELTDGMSCVDVSASVSDDGKTLYVAAINYHPTQPVAAELNLSGAKVKDAVNVITLNGAQFTSANHLGMAPEVAIASSTLTGSAALAPMLPAHSVSIFEFTLD